MIPNQSPESNVNFEPGVVQQNWDEIWKNRILWLRVIFGEVYDFSNFGKTEPKTEPPEFQVALSWTLKIKKILFFVDYSQWVSYFACNNPIFETAYISSTFGMHKRNPKRNPWASETTFMPKFWVKMKMNYFQSTQNNGSEGSVLGSVFSGLKSIDRQLSLEKN